MIQNKSKSEIIQEDKKDDSNCTILDDDICISGISGSFPDCLNVKQLKENLYNKVDMVSGDERRWKHFHPEIPTRSGKIYNVEKFDSGFFDSGVHGGLVVLEPSFNGDTMATALGIPGSKNIIRRHLTAELEALVLPARSTLEHYVRLRAKSRVPGGSLGRTYSRSCAGLAAPQAPNIMTREQQLVETRRSTIRGSISRALGLSKTKTERDREKHSPTSSSESSSVRSRASPTYFYKSSRSGGESPIYAQPFAIQHPSSVYNRKSEDYDVYLNRRSMEDYEMKFGQCVSKSERDRDSTHSGKSNPLEVYVDGKLHHKPRKQHRRVRSISDIDAINNEATST